MKNEKINSQIYLRKCLNKLKEKEGRFNLSMRYYRDTKNKEEHDRMNRVFKEFYNKNVLDIGCHIGYYATLISSFANTVIGIDISEEIIRKANSFKKITGVKNTNFKQFSAFDLDDNFMINNNINAIFIHKTVGDSDSNTHWSLDNFEKTFSLFKKYGDLLVCDNVMRIKQFFEKDGISVKKFPSYRSNFLLLIKIK